MARNPLNNKQGGRKEMHDSWVKLSQFGCNLANMEMW